ncbi:MAG TPA: division/cell wall cluster transcriptional repressor MraZ [Solirubrobacteraceae bacterium]|nr:division/cell wall cluster transcriptional repressor MraZ [Solirubrobacteraceae bacterium]
MFRGSGPGWRGSSHSSNPARINFAGQTVLHFHGTFDHTLDAKGRLTVPARFRSALADGLVLVRPVDLKPCVAIWRKDEYAAYCDAALKEKSPLSKARSDLERFFYGNSMETDLDAAGRVMMPANLAEQVSLGRDVVVVGAGSRLEIWSRDVWNDHQSALHESVSEVTADADRAA